MRIYSPAKWVDALNRSPEPKPDAPSPRRTAMQSGQAKKGEWKIDFDVLDKWENPVGTQRLHTWT